MLHDHIVNRSQQNKRRVQCSSQRITRCRNLSHLPLLVLWSTSFRLCVTYNCQLEQTQNSTLAHVPSMYVHTDTVSYDVESLNYSTTGSWAGSFPTNYRAILPLMVLYRVDHPIGHLSYSPLPASAACSFLHARFDVPMTSTVFGNCTP